VRASFLAAGEAFRATDASERVIRTACAFGAVSPRNDNLSFRVAMDIQNGAPTFLRQLDTCP
jgi:hypothetical protein